MTNTCCLVCCNKLRTLFTFNPGNVQDLSSTVCQLLDLSEPSIYAGYITTPFICFSCHQKIVQVQKLFDEIEEIKTRIEEFKTEIGDGFIKGTCQDAGENDSHENRSRIAEEVKRSRLRLRSIDDPHLDMIGRNPCNYCNASAGNSWDSENSSIHQSADRAEILFGCTKDTLPPTSEGSGQKQIEDTDGFSGQQEPISLFNIEDISSSSSQEIESYFRTNTKSILNFNFNFNLNENQNSNLNNTNTSSNTMSLTSSNTMSLTSSSSNTTIPVLSEPSDIFDEDDEDYFQAPDINIDALDSILEGQKQEQNKNKDQELEEQNMSQSQAPVQESNSNSNSNSLVLNEFINHENNIEDNQDVQWIKTEYNKEIKNSTSNSYAKQPAQPFQYQQIYLCNHCQKLLSSPKALSEHISQVHEVKSKYKCPYPRCNKIFEDLSLFKRHRNIHKNINNNFCPICKNDDIFEDKYALYRHIQGRHYSYLKRMKEKRNNPNPVV